MSKKLVIVESPTKAKTLGKFLGADYTVLASYGHVADLPKSKIAVDTEHDFKATYIIPEKAEKHVKDLREAAQNASEIYLATDPDREGEAIAWHIGELLGGSTKGNTVNKGNKSVDFKRVAFHEITKSAVEEAFAHPGVVNMDLVNAQQARRILDRLVGYELSPLLWKKVIFGLSAGRVQSAAVRLVVERERERQAFKPKEYWEIGVPLVERANAKEPGFAADFVGLIGKIGDNKIDKLEIGSADQAAGIVKYLEVAKYVIRSVDKSEKRRSPYAPFITSSLQQAAGNAHGFTAKRTMDAAQKLFEAGLITYHRTDSTNLSPQFVSSARDYIGTQFGSQYLPATANIYATKSKNAQEAHEAIRVTDVGLSDMGDKGDKGNLGKIYRLIWERSLASQMTPAVYDTVSVEVVASEKYLLRASGSTLKFEGWLKVQSSRVDDSDPSTGSTGSPQAGLGQISGVLNKLTEGEMLYLVPPIKSDQHFTEPPARYTESSLIKIMEEYGIGRPSTYAPTINTIQTRGYVGKEGRALFPKDVAFVVNDLLVNNFPDVVDYAFTAHLEDELDDVAAGKAAWVPVIRDFYGPFHKLILAKDKELKKSDFVNVGSSDKLCPECGKPMVYKLGRYGKFLSCSGWPDCKYAEFMETPEKKLAADVLVNLEQVGRLDEQLKDPCPLCGAKLVLKSGPFGEFIACENYPKCKFLKPIVHYLGLPCPKCGTGEVVIKQSKRKQTFFGCSRYPSCDYVSGQDPRLPAAEKTIKKPRKTKT